jgi:hypothetical protein
VVATAATVAAVALMAGGPGTTGARPDHAAQQPAAPTRANQVPTKASSPAPSPTNQQPSGSASAPAAPGTPTAVPVYYAGDTSHGPRLFREFHTWSGPNAAKAAVTDALTGSARDGDYHTLWPAGTTVSSVRLDATSGAIEIDLGSGSAGLVDPPAGMSETEASEAVQALVYTAQGALQSVAPVRFLVGGSQTDTILGVPSAQPVGRADQAAVLAQVFIIDPAQAASVTSPFRVDGQAAAFEANVQWELKQGGRVVKRGFTTARECCTLAPYHFSVKAPPGNYTLVVHDEDASGGQGRTWQDTKQITVK